MITLLTLRACPRIAFITCDGAHQDLHSFPTRRSSDLTHDAALGVSGDDAAHGQAVALMDVGHGERGLDDPGQRRAVRSEEHTSELQSHSDLVCRLLLEKKKDWGRPGFDRTC